MISIIILSALTIGANTYDLPPVVMGGLSGLDTAITVFFLVEILFRFAACPVKRRFFFDGWNVFDTLVVIGSLIPLDNSEAVLLGRLLRVFRVLRLVSVVPELRFLINSLLKAIPRMGYIALLMFIIFYIYAAMGSMFFASVDEELWGDVAIAMLTLFRVATFEDWTDVMYATMEQHPLSWIYYLTFIFLTAFVFLNMMIGATGGDERGAECSAGPEGPRRAGRDCPATGKGAGTTGHPERADGQPVRAPLIISGGRSAHQNGLAMARWKMAVTCTRASTEATMRTGLPAVCFMANTPAMM